jgi:hypothetical protein
MYVMQPFAQQQRFKGVFSKDQDDVKRFAAMTYPGMKAERFLAEDLKNVLDILKSSQPTEPHNVNIGGQSYPTVEDN